MKLLVVDTYYDAFLARLYRQQDLGRLSFAEQRRRLLDACFGTADYYSRNLASLGVDAEELVANCVPLQLAWLRERHRAWRLLPRRVLRLPRVDALVGRLGLSAAILVEQVREARPDVLYLQDLRIVPPRTLRALKRHVGLVVGQLGSPPPPWEFLAPYDLMLTSFPHFVPRLRARGLASDYFRLGFEPAVLARVGTQAKRYDCTFVGGFSSLHVRGNAFVEEVAAAVPLDCFGYGVETLPASSPIRRRHHGEAWALDAFRVFAQSRITINRHGEIAEDQANNMRLYEATGMGAMLLTDAKANLHELFDVGREVVAYDDARDAVDKIRYYTAHPEERDAIARAGQLRTLGEHTYEKRMIELNAILGRHLSSSSLRGGT